MTSKHEQLNTNPKKSRRTFQPQAVSLETKNKLIEMVQENGITVFCAAKVLNIKTSTANSIFRKHMQTIDCKRNGKIKTKIFKSDKIQKQSSSIKNQPQMPTQNLSQCVNNHQIPLTGFKNVVYPFWDNYLASLQLLQLATYGALQTTFF